MICSRCRKEKSIQEFKSNKICIDCSYNKAYSQKNKEKNREYNNERSKKENQVKWKNLDMKLVEDYNIQDLLPRRVRTF